MKRVSISMLVLSFSAVTAACGSPSSTPPGPDAGMGGGSGHDAGAGGSPADAAPPDAPPPDAATDASEAGPGLTPCPTTGTKGIQAPAVSCYTVTPAETGAAASGENATVPSYALFPDSNANGKLVLFFNGSGGSPEGVIASPTQSFYTAATSQGYAVLGLSYYSKSTIASLCANASATLEDACYFPTRETIILGVPAQGASPAVAQAMTVDQSIAGRAELALTWLEKNDPAHAWGSFLTTCSGGPATCIAWSKVTVAGHSQGGGHAAAVGKLFGVARVIQLSSVCDEAGAAPASWTKQSNGPWSSDPTQFFGLAAPTVFTAGKPTGGDITCPLHAANWTNLGMVASHQHDDAATCGATGDTHGASIGCVANYATWQSLLQ